VTDLVCECCDFEQVVTGDNLNNQIIKALMFLLIENGNHK